jgi:hypothetical protein
MRVAKLEAQLAEAQRLYRPEYEMASAGAERRPIAAPNSSDYLERVPRALGEKKRIERELVQARADRIAALSAMRVLQPPERAQQQHLPGQAAQHRGAPAQVFPSRASAPIDRAAAYHALVSAQQAYRDIAATPGADPSGVARMKAHAAEMEDRLKAIDPAYHDSAVYKWLQSGQDVERFNVTAQAVLSRLEDFADVGGS